MSISEFLDIFKKKAFAHLATIMPDGSPQVTPVWVSEKNGLIWINSAQGRQKDLNMERDPRVALSIQDPDDPYRYLQVRGVVAEITKEGADAHIDQLAQHYLGLDKYPYREEGEVRKIYKINPD